ncbi:hypothetical protein MHPYR_350003 [uncultured Mycobacterium sp.]|uniref:Uncharacterized protein n=1 Tax=uncultured Mycobacterium sp. TaxID=171292 RepID=A0A1Y5PKE9_9MYCO|nr:hypothetical protein MHPYR_350003 [uncultured Mycobacterium sp.]
MWPQRVTQPEYCPQDMAGTTGFVEANMRGYHPSGMPAVDADQETLAHDRLALISALGASEAVLIGHDWVRRPHTVRRRWGRTKSPR